ncbi:hypothetical protein OA92_21230 [Marinomonas sp. SBI22]|uniref:hypothetical protein n=1 Tax=unclassified Marinomonas TaxID=196814 RepID=UPI0005FA77B3|nr:MULTISPECIES: hypothetical protein [unclassified Marinomonas]KJZ09833.1 hypothetical protein TW85_21405 [Marinomonas sp. S3726]KZM39121.1 hypothetical protein OA92_21230 [Marinomonas sp. SBI22]KZM39905.1 hypothetical protein OA91_21085 [Marinomonas sp. SBI8L]
MKNSLLKLGLFNNIYLILVLFLLAAYSPVKDMLSWTAKQFANESIQLVDISFGNRLPWQAENNNYTYVNTSNNQPSYTAQVIHTRIKLSNPSNESKSFKKIWLTFEHANGATEYTTDYSLYNIETRQKLVGSTVKLAPNTELELLASYRFIPSYPTSKPQNLKVSWENESHLREKGCLLNFDDLAINDFGQSCYR